MIRINPCFEIVNVAGEYMAIPLEHAAASFNGIIALNEAAAYLLKHMSTPKSKEELLLLLMDEYKVDRIKAKEDVEAFIDKLLEYDLIIE